MIFSVTLTVGGFGGSAVVRNALIVVLLVAIAVLADRVVREENQRYALLLGMCIQEGPVVLPDFECLDTVQTRTSWLWHLYYGITDPIPRVDWTSGT